MTDPTDDDSVRPGPSSAVLLAGVGLTWALLYWGAAALVAWGSGGSGFDGPDWSANFDLINGVAASVAFCGLAFAVSSKPEVKVVLWILAAMAALQLAGVIYAFSVK